MYPSKIQHLNRAFFRMLREAGMSGQIVSAGKAAKQVKQGQEGGERGEKHCIAWKSSQNQILC